VNILMLNWRDIKNPLHGGAEVVTHEHMKRWVKAGHSCTLFASAFPGCLKEEEIEGYKVVRGGNRYSVYYQAYRHYKENRGNFDLVIDQVNTIPFFTPLYVKDAKIMSFFHQLCREIWFYEMSFPFSLVGYVLEPLYLRLYRKYPSIAVSESTRKDLLRYGIRNVSVIPEGINFEPLKKVGQKEKNSLIYVGRLKKSKRVHHILRALALVTKKIPDAKLYVVGEGDEKYKNYLKKLVKRNNLKNNVKFTGYIDFIERNKLMSRAEAIIVASVKEGWGLIATEANALGTAAIVYDVDGLRDSVRNNVTGLVVEPDPDHLSEAIVGYLQDNELKRRLSKNALEDSRRFDWDKSAMESLRSLQAISG